MKSNVQVKLIKGDLFQSTKVAMWEVYKHYYNYDQAYFMERMSRNNYFVLYYFQNQLVGFTGLRINDE